MVSRLFAIGVRLFDCSLNDILVTFDHFCRTVCGFLAGLFLRVPDNTFTSPTGVTKEIIVNSTCWRDDTRILVFGHLGHHWLRHDYLDWWSVVGKVLPGISVTGFSRSTSQLVLHTFGIWIFGSG